MFASALEYEVGPHLDALAGRRVLVLVRQLEGAVWSARLRPLVAAVVELGVAAGVWMQRGEWLGWTGA